MFKKVGAVVIGIGLALGTAACSGGDAEPGQATVTVTEQATPNTEGADREDVFLMVLRDNTDSWDAVSDESVLSLASLMCDAWDAGADFEEIGMTFLDDGFPVYESGFFIGSGTEAFCPEYNEGLDNNPST